MKYWNKQREYRRLWLKVPGPPSNKIQDAKRWCQINNSEGKFYFHYSNKNWWFENQDDALAFSLAWGTGKSE